MKNIETVLALLGFKERSTLKSKHFVHYQKNDNTHLFAYTRDQDMSLRFSSPSGEWDGNLFDVITFYYLCDNSSNFNEADRIALFLRENNLSPLELESKGEHLSPVPHFNLYKLLFSEHGKCLQNSFNNALESETHLYFFFMDEDITALRQHNILGVVSYDKVHKTEQTVMFSDLDRSIYFSNPSIAATESVAFNSFKEMIAFNDRMSSAYFYIVFKGNFNSAKAKTISLICETKGIENTFLAFPDSLQGYFRDIEYLSIHAKVTLKVKTGYLKLSIPQNTQSDLFIQKLKDLKSNVEKELDKNSITNLIVIMAGKNIEQQAVFVVEVATIANILKGFLVLASKYLLADKNFKIIKPKQVFWAQQESDIKNVGKEFKLNIYDTIGKVYAYN